MVQREIFANALSIISFAGGRVTALTAATAINGAVMAMLAARGDFPGPRIINRAIIVPVPVISPAHAPAFVTRRLYKPSKYGAANEPETAPQLNDIR